MTLSLINKLIVPSSGTILIDGRNIAVVPGELGWKKDRISDRIEELLDLDEPFGALDPISCAKMQDEFLRIQEKIRKTIVFVTHDIEEAIKMGDSIAVMRLSHIMKPLTSASAQKYRKVQILAFAVL